jgi:hypothetical protein
MATSLEDVSWATRALNDLGENPEPDEETKHMEKKPASKKLQLQIPEGPFRALDKGIAEKRFPNSPSGWAVKPAARKPVATMERAPRVIIPASIPAIPTWVNSEEQAKAFLATRARENAERAVIKKKFIQSELEECKLQRPLSLVD